MTPADVPYDNRAAAFYLKNNFVMTAADIDDSIKRKRFRVSLNNKNRAKVFVRSSPEANVRKRLEFSNVPDVIK